MADQTIPERAEELVRALGSTTADGCIKQGKVRVCVDVSTANAIIRQALLAEHKRGFDAGREVPRGIAPVSDYIHAIEKEAACAQQD